MIIYSIATSDDIEWFATQREACKRARQLRDLLGYDHDVDRCETENLTKKVLINILNRRTGITQRKRVYNAKAKATPVEA